MSLFFSSDHHFGHENILKHCAATRPFGSLGDMHAAYVERWNDAVRPNDTVWYIGDFSLRFPVVPEYLARLHGRKHLLVGNHDLCFKLKPQQVQQYMKAGFETVERQATLELAGLRFALCHFPYRTPDADRSSNPRIAARQAKYAPFSFAPGEQDEVALIHGHVHQHWRARVGAAGRPELNVAVDAWAGAPVSEAQLVTLYREAAERAELGQMSHDGAWGPLFVEPESAEAYAAAA